MKPTRHLSSLVVLAGALQAQTPEQPLDSAPPAAPVSSQPAPAAAEPAPAAAPTVTTAQATPATAATADAPKTNEASEGFAYHPGATFGTVTMNGQTWTRLSFTPEISYGKLGVGFNVELFMDQNQNFSSRGWDFDTPRNGLESVLRKIEYVRWDHPGATFYARLGTLEGITMGFGLVAADYGNKALYPDFKELGTHVQLNDISPLGVDLEGVVNNLQDLQNGGPFTAFRAGFRPFKPLGLPLFDKLAVRVGVAYDWNQYAGLRDVDDDGCPDAVDKAPNDPSTCVNPLIPQKGLPFIPPSVYRSADSAAVASSDSVRSNYAVRKPFSVYWAEASLPIITTAFFGLELHSAIAKPKTEDPLAAEAGWGAIPLGAGSHLGPITLTAEYRAYSQPFQPNYFDALYDVDRARSMDGKVETKEIAIYGKQVAQKGMMQGYFAKAGWDLLGFLKLQADYSDLFSSKAGEKNLRAAGGSIGIGPQVTSLLQQKISLAEVYFRKDRIGLDTWTTLDTAVGALPVEHHDAFTGRSTNLVYGYRVGSQVAAGMTIIVDRQTTFTRDAKGNLQKQNQMRIESQIKF